MIMKNSPELVTVRVERGIAHLRFNRPDALNAVNEALAVAWREAVMRIRSDEDVRVVVLSGEGRSFMVGGDLRSFHGDLDNAGETAARIIDPLNEGLLALAACDAPVIASVQGAVAGAGMSIALGADFCIAAETAVFNMAYARIGASLDAGGSWFLPRSVGLRKAMSIALLCEPIGANEAFELQLVNKVVPPEMLEQETTSLATKLAQGATPALGRIRRLLRGSLQRGLAEQLAAERDAFVEGTDTSEFREGVDAFVRRRLPVYLIDAV
jgi:2-(1,2-epoxy-1,2-dihydrophenyl)acetyl-CoA isomerase